MSAPPTRLVGFHYPAGQGGWGQDVLGMLIGETPEGWVEIAAHVSSGPSWSRADIGRHVDIFNSGEPENVPYEWLGEKTSAQVKDSYPPAVRVFHGEEEVGDVVGPAGVDG